MKHLLRGWLVSVTLVASATASSPAIRGMKPAGGISDAKTSLQYLVTLRETLGQDWLTPDLFRIGASRLANDILMQLRFQRTGAYQSGDYFTVD